MNYRETPRLANWFRIVAAISSAVFVLSLCLPACDCRFGVFDSGRFKPVRGLHALFGSFLAWGQVFDGRGMESGEGNNRLNFMETASLLLELSLLPCNIAVALWPLSLFRRLGLLVILFLPALAVGCLSSSLVFAFSSPGDSFANPHSGYYLWLSSIYLSMIATARLAFSILTRERESS